MEINIFTMAAVAALIAALAIGGGTAIAGGVKAKKARLAAEANERNRPKYQIPQSEFDTLGLLEGRAGQGLSDSSLQYFQQNQDRALSSGINAILQGGGSPNNISNLLTRYSDANGRIALADDQARINNINALIGQRQRLADYEDKQFQVNEYAPFADRAQKFAQERAQGQGMVSAGLNTAASGLGNFIGGLGRSANTRTDTQLKVAPSGSLQGTTGIASAPAIQPAMNFTNWSSGIPYSNNGGYDLSRLSPEDYQTVTTLLNK